MNDVRLLQNGDIVRETILGGNIDVTLYTADVMNFQRLKLKPLLGKDLYEKICEDYDNETLSGLYLELYTDYVKQMVIHGATELFLAHGAYIVSNAGILRHQSQDMATVSKEEIDFLIESSRKLYRMYEDEFHKWIKDNHIEEYDSCLKNDRKNVMGWRLKK